MTDVLVGTLIVLRFLILMPLGYFIFFPRHTRSESLLIFWLASVLVVLHITEGVFCPEYFNWLDMATMIAWTCVMILRNLELKYRTNWDG